MPVSQTVTAAPGMLDVGRLDDGGTWPDAVGGSAVFWASKRLFDIVVSLALLPVLAVLAILVALINRFANPGPLFFTQERMGLNCEMLKVIKFRSMVPVEDTARAANDPIEKDRIRPFGELLRKMRIDELPQIINVLKGEMSLIGPRPDYHDHASVFLETIPDYRFRHVVRPGISGLAQVTLGYAVGQEATRAKAAADMANIKNAGWAVEARVFWFTLVTVFLRRGS